MMKIQINGDLVETDESVCLYDSDREEFRLVFWEEDGVIRLMQTEPIILVTPEEDLDGAKHRRNAPRRRDKANHQAEEGEMSEYAEMAKLAKRIEFLESREQVNGAESWLKLEERITAIETRMQICPADIAGVWNPCATCNGAICDDGKELPGLRKQIENNWTGDKNPTCYSDEAVASRPRYPDWRPACERDAYLPFEFERRRRER